MVRPKIACLAVACLLAAWAFTSIIPWSGPHAEAAASGGYTLTFPQTVNGQLGGVRYQSNIFLLNNSKASARGTVYLYAQDGQPMTVGTNHGRGSSFAFSMPPGSNYRFETDGLGAATVGWVEVVSDIPLSGSGSFVVFDAEGRYQTEVGIGDSARGRSMMIFVDNDAQTYTSFAVCNTSATNTASLTFELRRPDGSLLTTKSGATLGPRQQKAEFVAQTFEDAGVAAFSGTLVIKSPDIDISVVTLRSRGHGLTSLPSVPAVTDTGSPGNLLFSRIADGKFGDLRYQTTFILLNHSSRQATATIDLLSDTGVPLLLNLGGSRRSTAVVTVPAGGAVELESDGGSSPAATGWASVRSDFPVAGCALFTNGNAGDGSFVSQVGVPDSPATSKATIYAEVRDDIDTAFALNNPADAAQSFKVRLMRTEGTGGSGVALSERTLSLGARRHTAQFVSGTFAEVLDIQRRSFEGWVEIEAESGKSLSALTLRTRGPSLTSLPVAGLVSAADRYTTYPVVAATTTAESKGPVTLTASSRSVSLGDGTQVTMPFLAGSTTVTLTLRRETRNLATGNSEAAPSGSMRVLRIEATKHDASDAFNYDEFSPVITIPKREIGDINPLSVQILRAGPDPQTGAEIKSYLPASADAAGNLVFKDPWVADDLYDGSTSAPEADADSRVAAAYPKEVKYVPTTVQEGLNYKRECFLMRMVPDSSVAAKRKSFESLTPAQRAAERLKPVQNVILLVHGHNEAEKTGIYEAEVERPWYFEYKRDVWTQFYDKYLKTYRNSRDCATVFYEFIYPTYRGIFGDLDDTLASLVAQELAPQLTNGLKFNLFVVSHSMGGLVGRAGMQRFDQRLVDNLRRFVSWGSPHLGSSLYSFRLALTAEQYGARTTFNWFVRRSLRKVIEPSVVITPGLKDLRWIVPGEGAGPLNLNEFFYQASGGTEYGLVAGSYLYNGNLVQLHHSDQLSDRYTFLYGLTTKGLTNFKGDTKKDWENLEALTSELGKGATLNRWTIFQPSTEYRGAVRGDSDGAVLIESMCGGYELKSAVRINLGDVDHEEYFGAKAAQTSTETFNAMDFGNALYACPTVAVTSPTTQDAFDDDDQVTVDATLVWPGDAKAGLRIAEVVIQDAAGEKSFPLDASIEESGRFTGTFTAGDLGEGGPAGKGMRLIVVFKDNTELETIVMTGAILAWKGRVYVTTTLGKPYEYYAFNTTYDCSCKAQLTGPITKIRDASSTFTNFLRYWMVDMALDETPVAVKGVFNCKPAGEQQGAFEYPDNAKMKWQVDRVVHRVFDGTAYAYVPLTAANEFELKLAAGVKSQYLNIEVFQEWGASVTGPVNLSAGGKQGIASLVIDITRK